MQIATLTGPDKKTYLCRIKGDVATPIGRAYVEPGLDPLRQIFAKRRSPARVPAIARSFPVGRAKFHPPVSAPSKIVSVGANYRRHIREVGLPIPKDPISFGKYPSSLIGHKQAIRYRRRDSKRVDYETELIIVIGRDTRDAKAKSALDNVFGYTVCSDVSARDHQFTGDQFCRCKSFDTFTPLGPVIVTRDEIPDPQVLGLRTRVNGRTVQDSNTSDMMWSCAELIEYLSRYFTLEAGDLITTGTPEGVGFTRKPPVLLRDGVVLESEIDKLGTLVNPVKVYK